MYRCIERGESIKIIIYEILSEILSTFKKYSVNRYSVTNSHSKQYSFTINLKIK